MRFWRLVLFFSLLTACGLTSEEPATNRAAAANQNLPTDPSVSSNPQQSATGLEVPVRPPLVQVDPSEKSPGQDPFEDGHQVEPTDDPVQIGGTPCPAGLSCAASTSLTGATLRCTNTVGIEQSCCPLGSEINDSGTECVIPTDDPVVEPQPCPAGRTCVSGTPPTGYELSCQDNAVQKYCCPSGEILDTAETACVLPTPEPEQLSPCPTSAYCTDTVMVTGSFACADDDGDRRSCCPSDRVLNADRSACVFPNTVSTCARGLACGHDEAPTGWKTYCSSTGNPLYTWYCCSSDSVLDESGKACRLKPTCQEGAYCSDAMDVGNSIACRTTSGQSKSCCPLDKVFNAAQTSCIFPDLPMCGSGLSCSHYAIPTGYEVYCSANGNPLYTWYCCAAGKTYNSAANQCQP